jgi:hypothetical protein
MASAEPGLLRARRWAALASIVVAAALVVWPAAVQLADPAWPETDEFQAQLDAWERVLAPVDPELPAGAALAYRCAQDEQGRPYPDLDYWFDFMQAVLAPRRIGRQVESSHVLVHFRAVEGEETPSFGDARVVAELAKGLLLVERSGP